jgi:two-component sensor histidine kinase
MGASEQIQLAVEVPAGHPWRMDLSHAIPCGLVVTELVTNAIKHAFPDGRSGSISVRLGGRTEGVVDGGDAVPQPPGPWLEVADDGVGLPPEMDFSVARSLGFQLLPLLADQCGARLTLERQAGTCARLTWPVNEEGASHG